MGGQAWCECWGEVPQPKASHHHTERQERASCWSSTGRLSGWSIQLRVLVGPAGGVFSAFQEKSSCFSVWGRERPLGGVLRKSLSRELQSYTSGKSGSWPYPLLERR
ncbi:hypothetical protein ACRRTK_024387 [Alexandromys fortis]